MAAIGVVTAIANPALEAVVLRALATRSGDIQVVRRCVEIADALAVAASGSARAVVVGEGLPGLDADLVRAISSYGVVPIAVHEPGARWPASCRFPVTVDATDAADELAEAIIGAARSGISAPSSTPVAQPAAYGTPPRGRVISVWGPAGAPGRSTVALSIADEIARRGLPTLIIDADVYGGSIATMLGLLDESPGVAAACRAAAAGSLDAASLARTCLQVAPSLRVLTGISRSDRWPELQPAAFEDVVEQARQLAAFTIVDCGFAIEQDEELAYDTLAPRRNGATIAALERSDEILLVSGCDAVSVARGVRAVQELAELIPGARPRVVVNKVRSSAFQGNAHDQLREAFERFAGVGVSALLPLDQKACDTALLRGRVIADVAASSALRKAVSELAGTLTGANAATPRRRSKRARAR